MTHRLLCVLALGSLVCGPYSARCAASGTGAVQVIVLAGQSNMEGQAVVDLTGPDYNEGRGTLTALLADPIKAAMFQHLRDTSGGWRMRDDVWVSYQREDQPRLAGPLTVGFSVYGDVHHFGPELQFGQVVGDRLEDPVLLIKTAWGGKSLYQDFRPPSSGGEVGKYYSLMIAQVRDAMARAKEEFPLAAGRDCELAGWVWYHGWNDGVDPDVAVPQYRHNLVNLIRDLRREFQRPQLPFVIGELTGPWVQAEGAWETLRQAQAAAAAEPEFRGNVVFVPTHDFVRDAEQSPNPGHGHHEFGNAETYFLVGQALGDGMVSLLPSTRPPRLQLSSPLNYQVVQRTSAKQGVVNVVGTLTMNDITTCSLEARLVVDGKADPWRPLAAAFSVATPGSIPVWRFQAKLDVPAGGWYRFEVRVLRDDAELAVAAVDAVGVGEVFVVAGQSNSANYGEERQSTQTGRVASFDGQQWRLANDPQPGASGEGGSFLPPFGDAIASRLQVPVGLLACGIGATSVREWLPQGHRFPQPPTIESRVEPLPGGQWQSRGEAFSRLAALLQTLGPRGCRAVLWHQGESDANQADPTRTLPGQLYREYLAILIRESQRAAGWDVPWFVAQVSYHAPGDEGSPEIRAAQAALWTDQVALPGPDTDALQGAYRDTGGRGVHFSGIGLREHAARWVQKVAPWLEQQLQQ